MKPNQQQRTLEEGLQAHRAGQLAEAEAAYRRLLQANPRHSDALHLLGLICYQRGDAAGAVKLIGSSIRINPKVPECHNNIGEAYRALKQWPEAQAAYERAIALSPRYATAWNNLGIVVAALGDKARARAAFEKALALQPNYFEALHNLGVFQDKNGESLAALDTLQAAIRLSPQSAQAYTSLGVALHNLERYDEAIAAYDRALTLDPNFHLADYNRGNALRVQEKYAAAAASFEACVRKDPNYADAWNNWGLVLQRLDEPEQALEKVRRALALNPGLANAWNNLGIICMEGAKSAEAHAAFAKAIELDPADFKPYGNLAMLFQKELRWKECFAAIEKSLALKPDHVETLSNYGQALFEVGEPEKALRVLQRVLELSPGNGRGLINLAFVLGSIQRTAEALACYEQALAKEPTRWLWASNYLYVVNMADWLSPAEVASRHLETGRRLESEVATRAVTVPRRQRGDGKLRVGFVSPDLREHSVARFLEPLWRNYDRGRLEFYAYAAIERPDAMTATLQTLVTGWRDILGLSDQAAQRVILADELDLLIDLAGHTKNNRLRVFALHAAPVQATWLGYPATTGLPSIHYRLTDALADPPGTERFHSERLLRLDGPAWCFQAPAGSPPVNELPAAERGHVTFCSFNNPAKYSRHTVELWSKVLRAIPTAKMLIKGKIFVDEAARNGLLERFAAFGIPADRLTLRGWVAGQAHHLSIYGEGDIALDTFPYHGTTTTCEALWMGVPVVCRAGDSHVSRVGVSLLTHLGLTELIAESDDQYVAIAVGLAANLQGLGDLRANLRSRLQGSALMDGPRFARSFAAACETMAG